jgi:hypothetical protein
MTRLGLCAISFTHTKGVEGDEPGILAHRQGSYGFAITICSVGLFAQLLSVAV